MLHDLKDALDDVGVYEWTEVEEFVKRYFDGVDAQKLSYLIDTAVARFDGNDESHLEKEEQADFKIKAKQLVKIYAQVASIMPYENQGWEKLFWFLKFLIPKLKIADPEKDQLDALLDSVDLSSYGLERVRLNQTIGLDDCETELDPQNPNPRGAHGEEDKNPLDDIIRDFNERWFQGWSATPEEQRVKFVNIADSTKAHPDFKTKYQDETDPHHRQLMFEKMLKEIMLKRRKDELELYKLFAGDEAFKSSWTQSMQRMVGV